jgi:2,4-diaminopentanoate dehydrogenase
MDLLPLVCSASLPSLSELHVSRTIDLGDYGDLVHRFGLGEPPDRFHGLVASGEVSGHVGFEQSLSHLADVTGLPVDELRVEAPEMVALTDAPREGAHTRLEAGTVCAIRQRAHGASGAKSVITLTEFFAFRPQDHEVPLGDNWELCSNGRRLRLACPDGVTSLETTAAVACNSLEAAVAAPAGLLTMSDLRVRDIAARSR